MRIPGCSHGRANISRNHFSSLIFPSKFPSVAPAQGVRCLFDIQSVSSRLDEESSLNRHSSEFNKSKRGLIRLVQLYGETYEVELSGVNFIWSGLQTVISVSKSAMWETPDYASLQQKHSLSCIHAFFTASQTFQDASSNVNQFKMLYASTIFFSMLNGQRNINKCNFFPMSPTPRDASTKSL